MTKRDYRVFVVALVGCCVAVAGGLGGHDGWLISGVLIYAIAVADAMRGILKTKKESKVVQSETQVSRTASAKPVNELTDDELDAMIDKRREWVRDAVRRIKPYLDEKEARAQAKEAATTATTT